MNKQKIILILLLNAIFAINVHSFTENEANIQINQISNSQAMRSNVESMLKILIIILLRLLVLYNAVSCPVALVFEWTRTSIQGIPFHLIMTR